MATVFLYLNEPEEGGGTRFDKLNVIVTPKRGWALIWPSVLDHDPHVEDTRSSHEALPVERGWNYAANAWIHQRDFQEQEELGCG